LAKAFTRACPRAAFADEVWHRLPLGAAGVIEFSLVLDDAGRVQPTTPDGQQRSPPPRHLERLIERTVRMLHAGTFALEAGKVSAGTQRFRLSASIDQRPGSESVLDEPGDLRQIGRTVEPTRARPGKADFTYNSGRHVQLTIRMLEN
jgi:hypothetical protein